MEILRHRRYWLMQRATGGSDASHLDSRPILIAARRRTQRTDPAQLCLRSDPHGWVGWSRPQPPGLQGSRMSLAGDDSEHVVALQESTHVAESNILRARPGPAAAGPA